LSIFRKPAVERIAEILDKEISAGSMIHHITPKEQCGVVQ